VNVSHAAFDASIFDSRSDHANEANVTIAVTEDHAGKARHHMLVIVLNSSVT